MQKYGPDHRHPTPGSASTVHRPRVSAALVRAIVAVAEQRGVDVEHILADLGIRPEEIDAPGAFVDGDLEHRLWERVIAQVDPVGFGTSMACSIDRGEFREVEYAFRTSDVLGRAFASFARYNALIHGEPIFDLRRDADALRIRYLQPHGSGTPVGDATAEFALASVIRIAKDATADLWDPAYVSVDFGDDRAIQKLGEVVPCSVIPTEAQPEIVVPEAALELPMKDADPTLREIIDCSLRDKIDAIDPTPTMSARVRADVESRLAEGEALSLVKCASRLGVSTRTLQDRLQHEGTAFQELLRNAREDIARRLLVGTDTIRDIAIKVDYADVRAFRRAFKRWTGSTPSDYRRRIRAAAREGRARTPSNV